MAVQGQWKVALVPCIGQGKARRVEQDLRKAAVADSGIAQLLQAIGDRGRDAFVAQHIGLGERRRGGGAKNLEFRRLVGHRLVPLSSLNGSMSNGSMSRTVSPAEARWQGPGTRSEQRRVGEECVRPFK